MYISKGKGAKEKGGQLKIQEIRVNKGRSNWGDWGNWGGVKIKMLL